MVPDPDPESASELRTNVCLAIKNQSDPFIGVNVCHLNRRRRSDSWTVMTDSLIR